MLFQCDLNLEMDLLKGDYCSTLNSDDLLDPELPLTQRRAKGGTMALWKRDIDQFIKVLPSPSSSILPLVFAPPNRLPALLLTIYFPTAGKDAEFVEEITNLNNTIYELSEKYPDAMLFLRGDANANPKDVKRVDNVGKLCEDWSLIETPIKHPTYHHFVGEGMSDSQLDVLLHSLAASEELTRIICKLDNPLVSSHHDVLLSRFATPSLPHKDPSPSHPAAPRVRNTRAKILWTDSGILAYKSCIADNLNRLRSNWLNSSSETSISLLFQSTNAILDKFARKTNRFADLAATPKPKSSKKPLFITRSERRLLRSYHMMKKTAVHDPCYVELAAKHSALKKQLNQNIRYARIQEGLTRDRILDNLMTVNPSHTFKTIKALKNSSTKKIAHLHVGSKVFRGDQVPDGMFESIKTLKTEPYSLESSSPDFSTEYGFILDICKSGMKIPSLTREKTRKILENLRKSVNDFFSITALHYLHAGDAGLDHLCFLLNSIIDNVNNSSIQELNTIYAIVLLKGHGKDRNLDRSYRTISTCPLASKALDIYVRELSLPEWNDRQASTQFQGEEMSHELACLLFTETLQYSLNVSKLPVYAIFLDAKSAFDRVLKEILVRNLFIAGTCDQRLLYINERLSNRKTYCEYDKTMMGPIEDVRGLEQGGVSSSDEYKIYNNEQADSSQLSKLGVRLGHGVEPISCISLADDAVLISNNITDLYNLLLITINYCNKYQVQLVPDKTRLLAFSKDPNDHRVKYSKLVSNISLHGKKIPFSTTAEHLGIIRSCSSGNIPNISERLAAHRRSLFRVLPAGLALHHVANPAACLRVEKIYALPVLLSGLSALVLTKNEMDIISAHYKNTLSRIMNLRDRTPECVVFFLAGSLPFSALLHLRQLSLFSMICHLPGNILNSMATNTLLSAKPSSKSWFQIIRDLLIQYELPHPLLLLKNPMPKKSFKKLCKLKVTEYWHQKLTRDADLPSLEYLRPSHLSLSCPHPIWTSLDGNPYQAKAARIQALLLSGRYRTERLCRFWSGNKDGFCLLSPCNSSYLFEDLEHFILRCEALTEVRRRLFRFTTDYIKEKPVLKQICEAYLQPSNPALYLQFLLDCSVLPLVISAVQLHGQDIHFHLFRISRTWCRSLHVARLRLLGRY